ncbi:MAG: hypothetical protein HYX49_04555 [Chloroflexi bacterium]|nr:hypothetical protein [Chloroflexota bacterium]
MTILLISTIHRHAPPEACSGYLYIVNPDSDQVLRQIPGIEPPFREADLNPRGGMRGLRGISLYGGEIAIANYSSIACFDRQWDLTKILTNPVCAGIHDISLEADGVWASSSANDLLLKLDFQGNITDYYSLRDQRKLLRSLQMDPGSLNSSALSGRIDFRDRSNFNTETYDHLHINSFAQTPDGGLLISLGWIVNRQFGFLLMLKAWFIRIRLWDHVISFNRKLRVLLGVQKQMLTELIVRPVRGKSALLRFTRRGKAEIMLSFHEAFVPSHSVFILKNGMAIYLYTTRGEVIHFDPKNGRVLSKTHVTEEFLRGVAELGNDLLVLGAGTDLLFFNLLEHRVVKQIHLSDMKPEAIFSIQTLPPEFELPPINLAEKVGKISGYYGNKVVFSRD